jgi:hypothetical protein
MVTSKIVGYTGRRGSGKTLSMTKDLYNYYNNGFKVYSNYDLKFAEYVTTEEIKGITGKDSRFSDCVIAIDEIQILFDSSRFMSKENKDFSNFVQQIRKRGIILLWTTQFFIRTDVRIREHTDIIVRPNYVAKYKICDCKYIDITRLESDYGEITPLDNDDSVRVIFFAEAVFPLFDTKEKIR